MSATDTRVRELLETAVGEPPGSISVTEVRRLARRRRTLHGVTAASVAAACCAGVFLLALGLAGPLFGHSPGPTSSAQPGVPRYYIQEQDNVGAMLRITRRALVRDTATGAVTASVRCPWPGAIITGIAPADNNVFFVACQRSSGSVRNGLFNTRLYRFQLTSGGRVPRYNQVPGGALPGLITHGLTAAADGSEVAMSTATTGHSAGPYAGLLVINTRTGAHAVWRASRRLSTDRYNLKLQRIQLSQDLSQGLTLSPNGRVLRFFTTGPTPSTVFCTPRPCSDPAVRQLSPASKGGELNSARLLVALPSLSSSPEPAIYARVSTGGSALTMAAIQQSARAEDLVVEQISVSSGRVIRLLFRADLRNAFAVQVSSDPTGRYIILDYIPTHGPEHRAKNGWLDHGHLVPLTPPHGTIAVYETW
jgi:hypothetical protein